MRVRYRLARLLLGYRPVRLEQGASIVVYEKDTFAIIKASTLKVTMRRRALPMDGPIEGHSFRLVGEFTGTIGIDGESVTTIVTDPGTGVDQ